jgi:hypothetical protein
MLETYMKNKGTTKTIFHNNDTNIVKKYDWDIDYDGDTAKISIDTNQNGKPGHYDLEFDNNDLANIFKINSVKKPINERLLDDFTPLGIKKVMSSSLINSPEEVKMINNLIPDNSVNPYIITIDNTPSTLPIEMIYNNKIQNPLENILHEFDEMKQNTFQEPILLDIIKSKPKTKKRHRKYKSNKTKKQFLTHISSPGMMEKIIIPIDNENNNDNIKKKHFTKTHKRPKIKIHRVFRIPKTQKYKI